MPWMRFILIRLIRVRRPEKQHDPEAIRPGPNFAYPGGVEMGPIVSPNRDLPLRRAGPAPGCPCLAGPVKITQHRCAAATQH